jgi:hypothetical protein
MKQSTMEILKNAVEAMNSGASVAVKSANNMRDFTKKVTGFVIEFEDNIGRTMDEISSLSILPAPEAREPKAGDVYRDGEGVEWTLVDDDMGYWNFVNPKTSRLLADQTHRVQDLCKGLTLLRRADGTPVEQPATPVEAAGSQPIDGVNRDGGGTATQDMSNHPYLHGRAGAGDLVARVKELQKSLDGWTGAAYENMKQLRASEARMKELEVERNSLRQQVKTRTEERDAWKANHDERHARVRTLETQLAAEQSRTKKLEADKAVWEKSRQENIDNWMAAGKEVQDALARATAAEQSRDAAMKEVEGMRERVKRAEDEAKYGFKWCVMENRGNIWHGPTTRIDCEKAMAANAGRAKDFSLAFLTFVTPDHIGDTNEMIATPPKQDATKAEGEGEKIRAWHISMDKGHVKIWDGRQMWFRSAGDWLVSDRTVSQMEHGDGVISFTEITDATTLSQLATELAASGVKEGAK